MKIACLALIALMLDFVIHAEPQAVVSPATGSGGGGGATTESRGPGAVAGTEATTESRGSKAGGAVGTTAVAGGGGGGGATTESRGPGAAGGAGATTESRGPGAAGAVGTTAVAGGGGGGGATTESRGPGGAGGPALPSGAEFTRLRLAFAAAADFNPYWSVDEERMTLMKAVEARDVKRIVALSKPWLARVPVDADVHLARAQALKQLGDWKEALYHFHCFYGLLHSIAASGDGKSPQTAFRVIAVAEEYYLLDEIGAVLVQQSLQDDCDCMEVKLADGSKTELFFNVSISLGATRKMIKEGR